MKPSTGAYIGAALFVVLMIAFGTVGDGPPSAAVMATIGLVGVTSHLVLLPVVSASGSTSWARACGCSWIAIDVMLNVAGINGAALATLMPLRLGGHVLLCMDRTCRAVLGRRGRRRRDGSRSAPRWSRGHGAVNSPWVIFCVHVDPGVSSSDRSRHRARASTAAPALLSRARSRSARRHRRGIQSSPARFHVRHRLVSPSPAIPTTDSSAVLSRRRTTSRMMPADRLRPDPRARR